MSHGVSCTFPLGFWSEPTLVHEAASLGQVEKLQFLVDSGASINAVTVDNMTPLHDACIRDHPECVRVLLNAGAQVKCCLFSLVLILYYGKMI